MLSPRTAILYASLIILGSGALTAVAGRSAANAAPVFDSSVPAAGSPVISAAPEQPSSTIPRLLRRRIQQDLAQRLNVAPGTVEIVGSSSETWPDHCLGLARFNERCIGGEVRGWRVQVASAQQQWVYRSNQLGHLLRLEPLADTPEFGSGDFSAETSRLLLEAISQQVEQPLSKLQVLEVQPAVWNGCLGIFEPDQVCTAQAVSGFRTIIGDGQTSWVYHLNESGTQIAQNTAASGAQREVKATFVPLNSESSPEPELDPQIVFQSRVSGGLVAFVQTTTLSTNGALYSELSQWRNGRNQPTRTVIRQLSPAEVEAFQTLLQQRLLNLNRMRYLTQVALADYPMTQLQAPGINVEYIDLEVENLPPDLRSMIADWQALM